jgi:sugar O-acyltransferase (sialic acid O-acetyltransferase NeuD family)
VILGVYGAGGLGREVYEIAQAINKQNKRWETIVFIDDADNVANLRKMPIYKFEEALRKFSNLHFEICIAVGEPAVRTVLFEKLNRENVQLSTLIHPDVTIPESTVVGKGTIICKFVSITCDIRIGQNVYIHPMACIGHDATIGDNSVISSFTDVAGDCNVGKQAFLAIGTIMRQGTSIGDNSIVGMGSVVHRDIPDGVIAMGNPARALKKNERERVF